VIVALLALAMTPAPVFVESAPDPVEGPTAGSDDGQRRSLRDQLMLRLLEEGYPLAPSAEHATRTLRVEMTPRGLRVEARGADTRSFEVATGPVLPLEAVHRAMEALDEVTPRVPTEAEPPPRHAVHVDGAPTEASPEAVRRALVHSLLARHSTVVPLDAEPDAVLCAHGDGATISLSRGEHGGDCTDAAATAVPVTWSGPDPSGLDDSVDALVDALMGRPAPTAPTTAQPSAPIRPPAANTGLSAPRQAEPVRRGPTVRIGARAGIYGRLSSADAAVGTTLRVGGEPGPGGLFDVLMVPASAPDISIFETSISAGFGWMWAPTPTVALHLQGLAGLQIHRFRQRGAATGHRFDWTAEIPVGASLRLARRLRLDLRVRGGRTGRGREHRVDDAVVWSRNAWRIGASVGLSYGWRPR